MKEEGKPQFPAIITGIPNVERTRRNFGFYRNPVLTPVVPDFLRSDYNGNDGQSRFRELLFHDSKQYDPKGYDYLYPLPANNSESVRAILTEDFIYRKRKQWPLVPLQDFKLYLTNSLNLIVKSENDLFAVGGNIDFDSGNRNHMNTEFIKISNVAVDKVYGRYPTLKLIFSKYKGKIALCGGALTRIFADRGTKDADLFFYNTNEEEATKILLDCITLIVENALAQGSNVKIQHKLNVTNVIVYGVAQYAGKELESPIVTQEFYQFIHRVYPTLDSIIGGFDLGPSMLAFDGDDIYATPLGAYCTAKRCAIVDTTRRSTSFEHRIKKLYGLEYSIIFPGLTKKKVSEFFDRSMSKTELREASHKVYTLMRDLGLAFRDEITDFVEMRGKFSIFEESGKRIKLQGIALWGNNLGKEHSVYEGTDDLNQKVINRYSDYSDTGNWGWELQTNSHLLRTNNLDAVCVSLNFKEGESLTNKDIYNKVLELFDNPHVEYDRKYVEKATKYFSNTIEQGIKIIRKEVSFFAEFVKKIRALVRDRTPGYEVYVNKVIEYLNRRMAENAEIVNRQLVGIKWITQDPGRQWTSSINPIMENPREFYGKFYVPFWIGIPCEVETTLRAIRKFHPNSLLGSRMPTDVFKLILYYIVRAYTFNLNFYQIFVDKYSLNKPDTEQRVFSQDVEQTAAQLLQGLPPPLPIPNYIDRNRLPPVVGTSNLERMMGQITSPPIIPNLTNLGINDESEDEVSEEEGAPKEENINKRIPGVRGIFSSNPPRIPGQTYLPLQRPQFQPSENTLGLIGNPLGAQPLSGQILPQVMPFQGLTYNDIIPQDYIPNPIRPDRPIPRSTFIINHVPDPGWFKYYFGLSWEEAKMIYEDSFKDK